MMEFCVEIRNAGRMSGEALAEGKAPIHVASPEEFGGPPGQWTPEDLLSASIASCFELTLEHVLGRRKIEFESLTVSAALKLEKTSAGLRFTSGRLTVNLEMAQDPAGLLPKINKSVEQSQEWCPVTQALQFDEEVAIVINGRSYDGV